MFEADFTHRAHGFRFDHLSFVASHRRSERARNFLDLLRHSQMYEVFINERLALAAGGYKTSDAFEAKVSFVQGRRGKVLGRLVAQAGARGVSNLSAVLQRTSTFVKVQLSMKHLPAVLLPADGFLAAAVVCTSRRGNRLLRPAG